MVEKSTRVALLVGMLAFSLIGCAEDPVKPGAPPQNYLDYYPTAQVLPIPNDVQWASVPDPRTGLVTFDPTTAPDDATRGLYLAVNALKVRGFGPNAIAGIPLVNDLRLDPGSLAAGIEVVDMSALVGVLYFALTSQDPSTLPPNQVLGQVITGLSQLDDAGWARIQTTLKVPALAAKFRVNDVSFAQDGKWIKVVPTKPLIPNHGYLVIAVDGIVDVNGRKLLPPWLFGALKSDQPITGDLAGLEPLRQKYAPIFNYLLKTLEISKEEAMEIFTFTIGDKTLSLTDWGLVGAYVAKQIDADQLTVGVTGLPYSSIAAEYAQFDGAANLVSPLSVVTLAFMVSFDIRTLKAPKPTAITIPYLVRNGSQYSESVVVFQHGFGSDKSAAAGLATDMPILAIDLPYHGSRLASPTDPVTNCDKTKNGDCYLTVNLGQDRVNLYQTVFDLTVLLRDLQAGKFDINGDGQGDKPAKIYFQGQSMGSIMGSVFSAYNSPSIQNVVLNVGGANFASILDGATNATIADMVELLGLKRYNATYFGTMAMVQTLMDPADPVFLANSTYNGKDPFKAKTIMQTAFMDTVVCNASNEILAKVVGFPASEKQEAADFSTWNPVANAASGWYQFGGLADKLDNWMGHSFLLSADVSGYPEAAGNLDPAYVEEAKQAANAQAVTFFGGTAP